LGNWCSWRVAFVANDQRPAVVIGIPSRNHTTRFSLRGPIAASIRMHRSEAWLMRLSPARLLGSSALSAGLSATGTTGAWGYQALAQRASPGSPGPDLRQIGRPQGPHCRLADIEDELAHAQRPSVVAAHAVDECARSSSGAGRANIVRHGRHGPGRQPVGSSCRHAGPCRETETLVGILIWGPAPGKGRTLTAAMADKVISSERRGMGVDVNANVYTVWSPYARRVKRRQGMYTSPSGELKVLAKDGCNPCSLKLSVRATELGTCKLS